MSLPKYPEYKDSGTEWLGAIPSHWEAQPCRHFVVEQTAKNEDAGNQAYLSLMANVGIIPYEEKGDVGNKKPEDLSKCKLVSKGDLVINSMNYGIGSYGLSELNGVCSPVYIVLRPRLDRIRARFAFRIFENRAFQTYAQSFGNGILEHRAAINWDILKSIHVGVPPLEEQEAILTFLDRETGKIDALIAEQEKLLALLAEKRQATISHAVTKGLNPDVPLKDSGVAWLGEVPMHWELKQLKHVARQGTAITYGIVQAGPHVEGGIPYIKTSDMAGDSLPTEGYACTTPEIDQSYSRSKVAAGDLVIAIRATVGKCLPVPQELDGANLTQGTAKIAPGDSVTSGFLLVAIRANASQAYFDSMAKGATFKEITIDALRRTPLAIPPFDEQVAITQFVEQKVGRLDALLLEAKRSIELLKERRSALIAAAVTGQIDVRQA